MAWFLLLAVSSIKFIAKICMSENKFQERLTGMSFGVSLRTTPLALQMRIVGLAG